MQRYARNTAIKVKYSLTVAFVFSSIFISSNACQMETHVRECSRLSMYTCSWPLNVNIC